MFVVTTENFRPKKESLGVNELPINDNRIFPPCTYILQILLDLDTRSRITFRCIGNQKANKNELN